MADLLETAIRRREGMKAEIERLEKFIRTGEEILGAFGRGETTPQKARSMAAENFFSEA